MPRFLAACSVNIVKNLVLYIIMQQARQNKYMSRLGPIRPFPARALPPIHTFAGRVVFRQVSSSLSRAQAPEHTQQLHSVFTEHTTPHESESVPPPHENARKPSIPSHQPSGLCEANRPRASCRVETSWWTETRGSFRNDLRSKCNFCGEDLAPVACARRDVRGLRWRGSP